MVSILLFGLVGVAGLGVVLGLFGDEEDFADDDPDGEDEDEDALGAATAQMTMDGEIFIGGDEDDEVVGAAEADEPLSDLDIATNGGEDTVADLQLDDSTISTGDGDDEIDVAGNYLDISAGDGDDTVTVTGGNNTIDGGAGDDIIDGSESVISEIFGGEGDDHLTVGFPVDETSTVDGGAGDDVLDLEIQAFNYGTTVATGGAGEDAFNVSVSLFDEAWPEELDALDITDFDAEEDTLELTAYESYAEDGTPLQVVDAITSSDNGEDAELTVLYSVYNEEGIAEEATVVITLRGAAGMPLDGVTLNVVGGADDVVTDPEDDPDSEAVHISDVRIEDSELTTGAGDDVIDLEGYYADISTGDGDDTVTLTGQNNTVDGGAGDDVIDASGSEMSAVYGGEGDDRLSVGFPVDGISAVDGGAGDDVLDLEIQAFNYGTTVATGGEGADAFNVSVSLFDEAWPDELRALEITDFDETADRLEIVAHQSFAEDGSPLQVVNAISGNENGEDVEFIVQYSVYGADGTAEDQEVVITLREASDQALDRVTLKVA